MPLESNTVVTVDIKVIFTSPVLMCLLLSSTDNRRGPDYVSNKCCSCLCPVTILLAYAMKK